MTQISSSAPFHLLFERGKGFLAWVIRTFTRSKFAHVAIAFREGSQWWVLEANGTDGRVNLIAWADFRPGTYVRVPTRIGMTDEVRRFVFSGLQGQPYSWADMIRAGAGLQPKNQGYQCAELVQKLYSVAGGVLPKAPTPQTIMDQLRALPGYEEFSQEVP